MPTKTATKKPVKKAVKRAPKVEATPQDELVDSLGIRYAKGRTVLTADGIKAAARVLKSGKPEAVAKEEGFGSHVVLFRTDDGNVAVQNAFTPKA